MENSYVAHHRPPRTRCAKEIWVFLLEVHDVLAEIRFGDHASEFLELAASAANQVLHANFVAIGGREECRCQDDVSDVAAADAELARKEGQVRVRGQRDFAWDGRLPDAKAVGLLRHGEINDEVHTPKECLVEVHL